MTEPNDSEESKRNVSSAPAANGADEAGASGEGAAAASSEAADPVAAAQADVARFREQWMRTAADFDNFRKRSRREVEDARKAGREELLKELLPGLRQPRARICRAPRAPPT